MSGAAAGFLATLPMTAVMSAMFGRLPPEQRYPLPPRLLTERLVPLPGRETAEHRLAEVAHYGYGAAAGALYPVFTRWSGGGPANDAAFGVLVWAGSYLGWAPAAGILPPATRWPMRRTVLMVAAHLVWGVSTGWTARALEGAATDLAGSASAGRGRPMAAALAGAALSLLFPLALDRQRWHREPFIRPEDDGR